MDWVSAVLVLLCILVPVAPIDNPYHTLGVNDRATTEQIKKAYKTLARKWHPDKNSEPEAENRFVEINEAYEILSDSNRREQFDRFGTFDEPRQGRQQGHKFFQGGDFFGGDFPRFRFERSSDAFDKNTISLRMYRTSIVAKSFRKPYLLFVYSEWCMSCFHFEPMWESVVNDLEAIGYGVGTVNNMMEGTLVKELRVYKLPTVVAVVEGRPVQYVGTISHKELIKFSRSVLPAHLVVPVTDHNIRHFMDSWKSNKVGVLVIGNLEKPRLRVMLAAMETQPFTRFGYVQIGNQDQDLRKVLRVAQPSFDTVLVFNERPQNGPVATMTTRELSRDSLLNLIQNNKFLILPRLSSQEYFDELCPVSSGGLGAKGHLNRKLCAVLVVSDTDQDNVHVEGLRDFVETKGEVEFLKERIRFTYMFANKQEKFLEALSNQMTVNEDSASRDLVVVWRTERNKAKYLWFRGIWDGSDTNINESQEHLARSVSALLNGKTALTHLAALNSLVDEHGPGWFTRFSRGVSKLWDTVTFHASKEEVLPAVSVLGTLFFIFLIGYGLNYAVSLEQEEELKRKKMKAEKLGKKTDSVSETQRMIRELRAETYFGMVRLLKPGCRTLLVLVDDSTKQTLIRNFSRAVAPWRNNKTLMFGFVNVDKNLDWFRVMLQHTLGAQVTDEGNGEDANELPASFRLKSINPKQVVGTVLALNGWRLYFNMYHPKHGPSVAPKPKRHNNTSTSFLGMDTEDVDTDTSEDSDAEHGLRQRKGGKKGPISTSQLLDGLPNWLDRLFEGSIRRYYIPEWPPIK